MNRKQLLHQAKLSEWAVNFKNQQASGLTAKDWCLQNGISIYAYQYWKRQMKNEYLDTILPEIVPLVLPSDSYEPVPTDAEISSPPASVPVTEMVSAEPQLCRSTSEGTDPSLQSRELRELRDLRKLPSLCISVAGVDISVDSTVSDALVLKLIKAVRHA